MTVSDLSSKLNCIFVGLALIVLIGSTAAGQPPTAQQAQLDLDKSIASLRQDVEQKLPHWKAIFEGLSMNESYDPDLMMGVCLRLGKSSMECRISVISGMLAFQKLHGDAAMNEAIPALKNLLLDLQKCEAETSCAELETELKGLANEIEAPPSRLDAIDPEVLYTKCLADQNPKDPCTKPLCVGAALFSANFVMMMAMDEPTGSEAQSPQQKQKAAELQRLNERMNKFALKAQQIPAEKECKSIPNFGQAAPKKQ